jgi:curved DNA-binding protein CbpA
MANISTKRILTDHEERLIALRKKHKTMLKRISTERGKLDRFKDDIRRIMNESAGAMQRTMEEFHAAQRTMQNVLEECAKSKIFTKRERSDFHWMKEDLRGMFAEHAPLTEEEFAEFARKQAEERNSAGWDFFNRFTPPVPEAEQRSIREVYKRLAAKFHPDKAAGNADAERRFNTIMQRINAAYQRGDIGDLLAIENEFAGLEDILQQEDSPLADLVEREMERVREELELCQQQIERLKRERKGLEQSHDGRMVKDFQRAMKSGVDPIQYMTQDTETAIAELKRQAAMFERVLSGEITKEQFFEEMERENQQQGATFVGDTDDFGMTEEDLMEFIDQIVGVQFEKSRGQRAKTGKNGRGKKR